MNIVNPLFLSTIGVTGVLARHEAMAAGIMERGLFVHQEGDENVGGGPVSVPPSPVSRNMDAFALDHVANDIAFRLAQLRHNNGVSTLADEEAPVMWDSLRDWFRERFQAGARGADLLDDARLALDTLDEIILLKEAKNFFSDGIAGFSEFLAKLHPVSHDTDFGPLLFEKLATYRHERDAAEAQFLVPYREAGVELERIIGDTREHFPFTLFEMSSRIKKDSLRKQRIRGWKDMAQNYDWVGIRILVGCHEEVPAAVAVIQGALLSTRASLFLAEGPKHYYRPLPPDVKDDQEKYKERGYKATHIDIEQVKGDGAAMPIAENQVMSKGMYLAGEIQRDATYKSVLSTDDMAKVYSYYAQAIAFVLDRESFRREAVRPVFETDLLLEIRDPEARNCMKRQHHKMEKLMDEYEKFTGYPRIKNLP